MVVAFFIAALLTFLWAYDRKQWIPFFINIGMWVFFWAFSYSIEVPGVTTSLSGGYQYYALTGISIMFIIIDIVFAVRWMMADLVSPKLEKKESEEKMKREMQSEQWRRINIPEERY